MNALEQTKNLTEFAPLPEGMKIRDAMRMDHLRSKVARLATTTALFKKDVFRSAGLHVFEDGLPRGVERFGIITSADGHSLAWRWARPLSIEPEVMTQLTGRDSSGTEGFQASLTREPGDDFARFHFALVNFGEYPGLEAYPEILPVDIDETLTDWRAPDSGSPLARYTSQMHRFLKPPTSCVLRPIYPNPSSFVPAES